MKQASSGMYEVRVWINGKLFGDKKNAGLSIIQSSISN